MNAFDLEAARRAAHAGQLERWVHEFLCGPGRNVEFSKGLHLRPRRWHGPVEVPVESLRRSCGPEPEMPFRESRELWEQAVRYFASLPEPVEAFPPLLVRYEQGEMLISDGNHRYGAFVRRGFATCWVVIWYPDEAEYAHHEAREFLASRTLPR